MQPLEIPSELATKGASEQAATERTLQPTAHTAPPNAPLRPERWVDDYGDYLYRYAVMRLREPALAEDAVQETFLAALQSRASFAGRSSEKTWLVGILKHKIIDIVRKRIRETPASDVLLPYEQEELFIEDGEWVGHWKADYKPSAWGNTPLAHTERNDFWRVFQSCYGKLPERLAAAFAMKEMDDADSAEICKTLAISESNLWVMLYRARMHLRRCLEVRWFASPHSSQTATASRKK